MTGAPLRGARLRVLARLEHDDGRLVGQVPRRHVELAAGGVHDPVAGPAVEEVLDPDELHSAIEVVAITADSQDDRLKQAYGGSRYADLVSGDDA